MDSLSDLLGYDASSSILSAIERDPMSYLNFTDLIRHYNDPKIINAILSSKKCNVRLTIELIRSVLYTPLDSDVVIKLLAKLVDYIKKEKRYWGENTALDLYTSMVTTQLRYTFHTDDCELEKQRRITIFNHFLDQRKEVQDIIGKNPNLSTIEITPEDMAYISSCVYWIPELEEVTSVFINDYCKSTGKRVDMSTIETEIPSAYLVNSLRVIDKLQISNIKVNISNVSDLEFYFKNIEVISAKFTPYFNRLREKNHVIIDKLKITADNTPPYATIIDDHLSNWRVDGELCPNIAIKWEYTSDCILGPVINAIEDGCISYSDVYDLVEKGLVYIETYADLVRSGIFVWQNRDRIRLDMICPGRYKNIEKVFDAAVEAMSGYKFPISSLWPHQNQYNANAIMLYVGKMHPADALRSLSWAGEITVNEDISAAFTNKLIDNAKSDSFDLCFIDIDRFVNAMFINSAYHASDNIYNATIKLLGATIENSITTSNETVNRYANDTLELLYNVGTTSQQQVLIEMLKNHPCQVQKPISDLMPAADRKFFDTFNKLRN